MTLPNAGDNKPAASTGDGSAVSVNGSSVQITDIVNVAKAAEAANNAKEAEAAAVAAEENDPWKTLPGFANAGPPWKG